MRITLKDNILIISVITFFLFCVTFITFYTKENFNPVCGCRIPIWVIIISVASFGMFTGSLVYYLLNKSVIKEKKDIKKDIYKTLNFLDKEERKILEFIINNSGKVYQSSISKNLNIDKVKTSRLINELEKKGLIEKEKSGMTNWIELDRELKELFV